MDVNMKWLSSQEEAPTVAGLKKYYLDSPYWPTFFREEREAALNRESAWLPPCMVLVINDNLYGLMFVLRYICRCVHLLCLISICWKQR